MTSKIELEKSVESIELPEDLSICHSRIRELMSQVDQKNSDLSFLRERLQCLLRDKFGTKSEKVSADQLLLFTEQLAQLLAEQAADSPELFDQPAKPEKPKSKHSGGGRAKIAAHVPRKRKNYHPTVAERMCSCGKEMTEFGVDIVEQLDYIPASFRVIEHATHKYSCTSCHVGVAEGRKPDQIISGGKPTEGLVAQISTAKYADHLPLYRQEQIYKREGVELPQSSMGRWLEVSSVPLKRITDRMLELVKQCEVIQADESPFDLIDLTRSTKKSKQGYVWVLYGDSHHPYTCLNFEPNRNGATAQRLLRGFDGILTTDGYGGYCWYPAERSANCNVHARRYFEKALKYDKRKAGAILALYTSLYRIEAELKGKSSTEILAVRKEQCSPIMAQMRSLLQSWQPLVPPKTTLGMAINYALGRWDKLTLFLSRAVLSPDTNLVENAIRPIAIGRKNWMHIGGEGGLQTASVHSTLVNTCKRLGINPYLYLRDVLIRLGEGIDPIDDLLPDRWQLKHQPDAPDTVVAEATASSQLPDQTANTAATVD